MPNWNKIPLFHDSERLVLIFTRKEKCKKDNNLLGSSGHEVPIVTLENFGDGRADSFAIRSNW